MGMSQMCTGAGDYFRTSKPHSEKLCAVTSPLFPAEGKHLLIETEDSESISHNQHSETEFSSEETTPYTGAYVLIRLGRSPQTQQSLKSLNLTSSTQ